MWWIDKARLHEQESGGEGQPAGGTPPSETPPSETPPSETPSGETPSGETPSGDTPSGDTPSGDTPSGDTPATPYLSASNLPDDWRKQLAGDDTEIAKLLERAPDLNTVIKNYHNAQQKIRAGELSNGLPENPTDEQLSEWRAANGVPEKAEDYQLALADGLVLADEDKAALDPIYEVAQANNVSNAVMSQLTESFLQGRQAQAEQQLAQDNIDAQQATSQLKETWGGDHQPNINAINGFLQQLPENVREQFTGARTPDGKNLFNMPEVSVFFADVARKLNPSATVVPNSSNAVADIKAEISKLEAKMREPGWHKDQASNDRLDELYVAQENMEKYA